MATIDDLGRQLDKWDREWADMMVTIWREKLTALRVMHTGRLYRSISGRMSGDAADRHIVHTFMLYGIYQDMGVGSGYKMSNRGGTLGLEFLDRDYRREHRMGRQRKPKRWFSKKYYASVKVMAETRTRMTAEEAAILVARIIDGSGVKDTVYG